MAAWCPSLVMASLETNILQLAKGNYIVLKQRLAAVTYSTGLRLKSCHMVDFLQIIPSRCWKMYFQVTPPKSPQMVKMMLFANIV